MFRKRLYWTVGGLLVVLGLLAGLVPSAFAAIQEDPMRAPSQVGSGARQQQEGMYVVYPEKHDLSAPLRTLKGHPLTSEEWMAIKRLHEILTRPLPKALNAAEEGKGSDAKAARLPFAAGAALMPSSSASFEGIHNTFNVLPPDTNGDIGYNPAGGAKYYFQIVNVAYAVWDVTDPAHPTQIIQPTYNNAMWSGFGGACESHNDGDPVVLFDPLAKRWLFSQFALDTNNGKFYQCIAVSQSADPTGNWYRYQYRVPSDLMNDYPKFGVWRDAYYMSANQFDTSNNYAWAGAGVFAFERSLMLTGGAARMIYVNVGAVTGGYGGMLPADLDGAAPSEGIPGYFIEWDDSTWLGDPTDTIRIWEFHVDWDNVANSTFGANASFDPNYVVGTVDVDPDMCGFARNCIPQPAGSALDAVSDRLMYRLAFRAWDDGSFSMVSNHTVDVDGHDHAGIHWFELQWDGQTWSMAQEGVYAPDEKNRWMGSIAMDVAHNMALGYSVSSSTVHPSVWFTGRLASAPAGTMGDEGVFVNGNGVQNSSSGRWGDYSMMGVDPQDGCTFWYTQEYYPSDSTADWHTRIGAFKFDSCSNGVTNDEPDDAQALIVPAGVVRLDATVYTFKNSDPIPSCVSGRVGATAWYTTTPSEDRTIGVDTKLSDYDTVLAVFTGSPGSFTEVACSDDAGGLQSHLGFQATANTTYYIMVGAKDEGIGGELHLHLTSFTDVTGDLWAWPYIEAMHQRGISGYSDGTYRPNNNVTRAQMAKFLLQAKHGEGYAPPSFSSYSFSDIEGLWAADWIEEAYQEGMLGGYADGTYRPNNLVTRAQMAKFILLGKHGEGYTPPSFSSYSFSDIEGLWAADWIEEAYQEGIVSGYGDGTYRPNNKVTRAQMAKFLANGFGLSVPSLLQ